MVKAAIVGIAGPDLTEGEAALLRALPPAGVILFARNIVDPPRLRLLTSALRRVLPPSAVLMVDQEGGRVARLRPPHWLAHPAAGVLGELFARDPAAGLRAAFLTGALIGLDCAGAGFDVACAPVLDLRHAGAHAVVGDRAYGEAPGQVARMARAVAAGLLAAGVQPVGKHVPGHGRAEVDSHLALPVVRGNDLDADLAPFAANTDLGWMMTAHILYPAWDAARPATLSPTIIAGVIRARLGFGGVLVSDDLAMQALAGTPAERATAALAAGCDLALYCPGDPAGTRAVLEAVPALSRPAATRLAEAAAAASHRRLPLDRARLHAERSKL
ncbi:MAG: beta-N-acetylhexosaminidase, partial [Rhodospirillales bacterium]|nr:beta-N-acetylhexosaminidase [Rhodospirillales bacterium]